MTRMSASNTVAKRAIEDTSVKTSDEKRFKIRKGDYTLFYTPLFHYDSEVFRNPTVLMNISTCGVNRTEDKKNWLFKIFIFSN